MLPFRPLIRYATFSGRASRGEYWSFMLLQGVVHVLCVGMAITSLAKGPNGVFGLMGWLGLSVLLLLACALPNYAVLARRLHDVGRSAKWMALILPTILSQMMMFGAAGHAGMEAVQSGGTGDPVEAALLGQMAGAGVVALIAMGCSLALFVMTVLPGTRGPNAFGSDPRDPDGMAPGPMRQGRLAGIDEDRLDDLFAQARRDARAAEGAYEPVFDFGPGSAPSPAPAAQSVDWGRPAYDPGVAPSRPFGRRA